MSFCGSSAKSTLLSRRLSVVKDPELKMRVIGIFDYFSQTVLSDLHDKLFALLKTIPQDRTFTQCPKIGKPAGRHHFWSIDLSSATDRFPISVQEQILALLTDKGYAQTWRDFMIGDTFLGPNDEHIKYAVGQPMGAKSS